MSATRPDVYSLDEIARAAYVDRPAVEALVSRGRLRQLPGTSLVAEADALPAARVLRQSALLASTPAESSLFARSGARGAAAGRPSAWSLAIHGMAVAMVLVLGRTAAPLASTTPEAPSRLVFLVDPGPGGGGGGGGARAPRPAARRLERTVTPAPATPSVPAVAPPPAPAPEPEPIQPKPIVAPVAQVAAAPVQRDGAIDAPPDLASAGPGDNGGAGVGRDGGSGPGRGNGIGDGSGGGFGGGPYRPGSGVEPPRLLREVKATYSEEARRANVTGDVLMEVVVRADGTVGSARVLRGLGYGLDERATTAVREWRFAPARRQGVPVDVAVEVAMEFTLR
jgi:periplasmic protein TonB